MSNNTAPSSKITLAWAIPVSAPQLGARLEAYVATKAAITTFRFGARNVTATALGDVPEEIIDMIAREVRNVVFKDDVKRWMKAFKCLTQKCSPMSHMTKSDISCWHECDEYGHHEDVLDAISEDSTERHNHKVEQWCTNLTNLDGTSRFSKCINIFTQDIGIQPLFTIEKTCEHYYGDIEHVRAEAFLALPLGRVPVSSNRCSGFASFSVSSSLGPSPDIELTATKSRRFTMAMSTLHIHPFDPMEDESVFEEEPKPCDCLRCCKEPYCNGGYGLSHDDEDTFGGTEDATSAASATDAAFADKVPDATNHKIFDHNAAAASDYGKAESTSDTGPDLGSKEKDIWPQLMILGCGELEAKDREY